jgi:hypothetical protein
VSLCAMGLTLNKYTLMSAKITMVVVIFSYHYSHQVQNSLLAHGL